MPEPSAPSIIQIRSKPGIKRDGTRLEGDFYVDGQWCRFQRGLPRKIGGYRSINKYLREIGRTLSEYTQDRLTYVHVGSANYVERLYIDGGGNTSIISDRTPLTGFTTNDDNLWQFTVDSKLVGGVPNPLIVAQVAPNLDCICNSDGGELFYGDLLGTDPLTPITLPTGGNASGGVVALHPYTFYYGNDGWIGWSVAGDPTDMSSAGSGGVNAASQKIVFGIPLRGGAGNAPSGLFWAADALIRATFVGGDPVFQFDAISTQTSIMSSRSVIEYDGIFYWIGTDRFLMFNGVVREIPNELNQNFFFDNLNNQYRQKVFATKVPRYGEIWWCFPKDDSTEPNHAIVFNVRENTWYDTTLPNLGRAGGIFPTVFRKPLMTGSDPIVNDRMQRITEAGDLRITEEDAFRVTEESEESHYRLWIHEQGVNEIAGQNEQPIQSYFETADISLPVLKGDARALQVVMLEPDFVQSGDLTVQVRGRRNARAPEVNGDVLTITETAATPDEQVVFIKTQRRELRFRFESNTIGGDYQMGVVLAHVRPGDGTTQG